MSPSAALDVTNQAMAEGFVSPVVIMRSAWEATIAASSDEEEQDKLVAVLQSASALHEALARPDLPDRLRFTVQLGDKGRIELDLVLDAPVLVIALPDET